MDWKQRALYQLMSDISEDCYCAGWMTGNEYTLWEMVTDQAAERRYGMGEVEAQSIEDMRTISAEVGGWIRWRDDDEDKELPVEDWGPVFTPMAEWLPMYERRMSQWAKLRAELAARSEPPNA
jgi:hypothetical protein